MTPSLEPYLKYLVFAANFKIGMIIVTIVNSPDENFTFAPRTAS